MKHGVTRYRITLDCYEAAYVSGRGTISGIDAVKWLALTNSLRFRSAPLAAKSQAFLVIQNEVRVPRITQMSRIRSPSRFYPCPSVSSVVRFLPCRR